jgi:hypothetical protein
MPEIEMVALSQMGRAQTRLRCCENTHYLLLGRRRLKLLTAVSF